MAESAKRPPSEGMWGFLWQWVGPAASGKANKPTGRRIGSMRSPHMRAKSMRRTQGVNMLSEIGVSSQAISSLLLTTWDNVYGPRIEQSWVCAEGLKEEAQMHIARLTLCGVISQAASEDIQTRFHVNANDGIIIAATIFTNPFLPASPKYAMCLIFKYEYMSKYLQIHKVVEDRMVQLVLKYLKIQEKPSEQSVLRYTHEVGRFCQNLEFLIASEFTLAPLKETIFSTAPFDQNFIATAITAHMQTQCSVVTGSDEMLVKMLVNSLVMFSVKRGSEKVSTTGPVFMPDFMIQGIVAGDVQMQENAVLENMVPLTWIDLHSMTITQTCLHHDYATLRKEHINFQIESFLDPAMTRQSIQSSGTWREKRDLFKPLAEASTLVTQIVNRIYYLPEALRAGYIHQAIGSVFKKACALIKYIEHESGGINSNVIEENTVRRLRSDLDLLKDADFFVVLGIAEKFNPGTYVKLMGNLNIIEEQFLRLFETF